ncbi:MAG: hypothetical protein H0X38_02135 [Planctomycetes bacterium]|nr:hypothetical protein [Planctomycetota bacterium]
MKVIQRTTISLNKRAAPRSLSWEGDVLVDWVGGGARYGLDGTSQPSGVHYAFRFDRAITSPDARFQVIYEALGTKAIILERGKIVRELNRSFYHAHVYEYPIVFLIVEGRHLLAHCPNDYNELEIEDVLTGEIVTKRSTKACDFFHSRLQVSPDARFLLSAGWVWHPIDTIQIYAVSDAIRDPASLDGPGLNLENKFGDGDDLFEIHSAAFSGNDRLVLAGEQDNGTNSRVSVVDLTSLATISSVPTTEPVGTLMPVGDHAVCFYHHPRLVDLHSGLVVTAWPELASGLQNSSIMHHHDAPPPIALDAKRMRFAVAGPDAITVIQLGHEG